MIRIKSKNVYDIDTIDFSKKFEIENNVYFVDTNIWYWMTYSDADIESYSSNYATFINNLSKSDLYSVVRSKLTYSELTHVIEIDMLKKSRFENNEVKKYRSNPTNRNKVTQKIETSLTQIDNIVDDNRFIDENLNNIELKEYIDVLNSTLLDGTDIMMNIFNKKNKIVNLISDDKDFASIEGINLFTLNRSVLNDARKLKKLSII